MALVDLKRLRWALGSIIGASGGGAPTGPDGHQYRRVSTFTTSQSVGGTFIRLGGTFSDDPLLTKSGFTGGGGSPLADITWPGPGVRLTMVQYNGTTEVPAGNTNVEVALGVNGVHIPESVVGGFPGTTRKTIFTFHWVVSLSPGDVIYPMIRNLDGTTNITTEQQFFTAF